MQAVILAGGKGTRLRPYSTVFPKPLMPIGDLPILEVVIRQLKHAGCTEVIMAVGHLQELLQAFFGNGEKWGLSIKYSLEDKPLGTAAPLTLIREELAENFLVMNGDVLTDLDYGALYAGHVDSGVPCTIAMYRKNVKIDLGVLKTDEKGLVREYVEKPQLPYDVSMGVYVFNREILTCIPENAYFDFPDLVHALLKENRDVAGYRFDGMWLDIGRPDDYERATEIFEENKDRFLKT